MVSMSGLFAPEAMYVQVLSYVPFFSPMVMFMRICVTDVPVLQIALAILINFASVLLVGYAAAKIYRVGVLMYGKPPKAKEILKYVFAKN